MTTIGETLRQMRTPLTPHGAHEVFTPAEVDAMLSGYADSIEKGLDGLKSVHEHTEGAFRAENARLRETLKRLNGTLKRLNGQMLALREEFPSQRVSHIIREIEEAL